MVREEAAARVLRPWLGAAFLAADDLCRALCDTLNGFPLQEGDLDQLAQRLNHLVFQHLRSRTGGDMRVLLDDGRTMRVRLDDMDQMADEALYLALEQLPRNAGQYQRLRAFAMTHDSLSALRALYCRFAAFQTADELALIARTARDAHPAYRWRGWLPE